MSCLKAIKRVPAVVAVFLVRVYQVGISPLFPACCRFTPTCSQYAIIAFKKYGFCKGLILAVKRIIRCRPGGDYGYDPVP